MTTLSCSYSNVRRLNMMLILYQNKTCWVTKSWIPPIAVRYHRTTAPDRNTKIFYQHSCVGLKAPILKRTRLRAGYRDEPRPTYLTKVWIAMKHLQALRNPCKFCVTLARYSIIPQHLQTVDQRRPRYFPSSRAGIPKMRKTFI